MQIIKKYYFPNTAKKLRLIIKACDTCNTCKYDRRPLRVEIQETPIPEHPYEISHLDIYQTQGQLFLSCLDKFSKYGRMLPIKSRHTVHVRKAFFDAVTSHIIPSSIVTDNEKDFLSPEIKGMMLDLRVRIYVTLSNQSEVNGQVERFHSTITELLRIQKTPTPEHPCRTAMKIVAEKYNNTIHSTTKKTPKKILFGITNQPIDPEQLEQIRSRMYDQVLFQLRNQQENWGNTVTIEIHQ